MTPFSLPVQNIQAAAAQEATSVKPSRKAEDGSAFENFLADVTSAEKGASCGSSCPKDPQTLTETTAKTTAKDDTNKVDAIQEADPGQNSEPQQVSPDAQKIQNETQGGVTHAPQVLDQAQQESQGAEIQQAALVSQQAASAPLQERESVDAVQSGQQPEKKKSAIAAHLGAPFIDPSLVVPLLGAGAAYTFGAIPPLVATSPNSAGFAASTPNGLPPGVGGSQLPGADGEMGFGKSEKARHPFLEGGRFGSHANAESQDGTFSLNLSGSRGGQSANQTSTTTQEPLPAYSSTLGEELAQRVGTIRLISRPGISDQIRINLTPSDLGALDVRLQVDDNNKVHLLITAESESAKELINKQMSQLKDALSRQNLGFGEVEVQVNTQQKGDSSQSYQWKEFRKNHKREMTGDPLSLNIKKKAGQSLRTADGGLSVMA